MNTRLGAIAAAFDARASTYNQNEWHRHVADALVAHCRLRPGSTVLDAGTGTGFVAVGAARVVGAQGSVLAVDLSAGMLAVARQHRHTPPMASITWRHGDAVALADVPSGSFDAAAVLLYMPVAEALGEWHRVLKPGGTLGFTTMRAGAPLAAQLFRDAAAAAGIPLEDPSAALGSEAACDTALGSGGFGTRAISNITVPFSAQDATIAWASNLGSPAHAAVKTLGAARLEKMKVDFETRVARAERLVPGSTRSADVLLARATR